MKNMITFLFVLLALSSCATVLTPEQTAYIQKISGHSNSITLPKERSDEAWGKAQTFISKYSSMKIQTVSDYIIETYNSTMATNYAWSASKVLLKDSVTIDVKCWVGEDWFGGATERCRRNEKILIDYIITSKIPYPELIAR